MRKNPMIHGRLALVLAASGLLGFMACSQSQMEAQPAAAAKDAAMHAIAVLHPTEGNTCHGTVRFDQDGDAMKVTVDLQGLTPGQHAIHVHEYGDCSALDATSAGGHYNPEGFPHGLPPAAQRHAGDFGNLEADADGNAHYELTVHNASVDGTKNPVLGRGVIVHEKPDDGGQPTGNAGGRVACGVIGIAKPPATMQ